jgi:hypothetical protein
MPRPDLLLIAATLLSACSQTTPQSDGGTQTIGVSGDGTVGIEVDSKTGKRSAWANFWSREWPESAPVFAPAYPGADISGVTNERRDGFDATRVSFETQDSVDAVFKFYEASARKGRIGPLTRSGDRRNGMAIAMTPRHMLLVDAKSTDESTKVSVIFGNIATESAS